MVKFFGEFGNRIRKLTGRMDQYQEAITFAEAGQPDHVRELLMTAEGEKKTTAKLLVVGRESTFSREVIDYALEMAQRMSYEIVASNTAPLSCETFKLFSTSRSKICQEFQKISEENVGVSGKRPKRSVSRFFM